MTVAPLRKDIDKMPGPEANTTEGAQGSCWGVCLSNSGYGGHGVKSDVIAPRFLHLPNHMSQEVSLLKI